MRLTIDSTAKTLTHETDDGESQVHDLFGKQAFELVSAEWLRLGWNQQYTYSFTWMGRPIIQLPEDMIRVQEVVHQVKPDVIVETGIAHGGSLIYSASLCKLQGKGRVIGVDIEIRPHNREAIEAHDLFPYITMLEGDSTAPAIVDSVRSQIEPDETVLVFLDSCHTRAHVLAELEAYHDMVSVGSYIVATDGIMKDLTDVPRGQTDWADDHPTAAAEDFVAKHPNFVIEQPPWAFNESPLSQNVTHWPGAWVRRKS